MNISVKTLFSVEPNLDKLGIKSFWFKINSNNLIKYFTDDLPVNKDICINSVKFKIIFFNNNFLSFTEFNIYRKII